MAAYHHQRLFLSTTNRTQEEEAAASMPRLSHAVASCPPPRAISHNIPPKAEMLKKDNGQDDDRPAVNSRMKEIAD
jgi:hypothetical protein